MPAALPQQGHAKGFDTFLKIEGVDGESLDDKHSNWIELLGFEHGMDQPTSVSRGSAGGAATGRTVHGDFVVRKYVDKASPKLYEAISQGKPFKKVTMEACRAGGGQLVYYSVILEEVLISKISIEKNSGGAEDLPVEEVALNYGKIEWTYTQQKRADGTGGGNVTAKYDLTKGK
jgi:type VI secretion system secreted protein Hcp